MAVFLATCTKLTVLIQMRTSTACLCQAAAHSAAGVDNNVLYHLTDRMVYIARNLYCPVETLAVQYPMLNTAVSVRYGAMRLPGYLT